jgi:GNAT superfamily N-acetyltransferase/catechol 2,3-dioxygenase-like lactoylglutathione lyase family enzyme
MRASAVLYVKDLRRMSAFYGRCCGLRAVEVAEDHCVLESDAWRLSLVRVPERLAASIELSVPARRRSEVPVKLAFAVPDAEGLRDLVAELGGRMDPRETRWVRGGIGHCDAIDPEGNVVQFTERHQDVIAAVVEAPAALDAQDARLAIAATMQHLGRALEFGWTRWHGGVLASVTGAEASELNLVLMAREGVELGPVASSLDEVGATGLPHGFQAPAADAERVGHLAEARAMVAEEPVPLMVLDDLALVDSAPRAPEGLVIRVLAPEEASLHPEVASEGFGAPIGPLLHVTRPSVLAAEGVSCYIGEADGRPVTTGLAVTVGSHVGLLAIATLPEHRRRGYGAALTARALIDAHTAGARWAWLQSSEDGFGVYERLGFRTVERSANWRSSGGP